MERLRANQIRSLVGAIYLNMLLCVVLTYLHFFEWMLMYILFVTYSILGELAKMKRSITSISADRFMSFLATHQALLYPVVQLQSSLQHKILGVGFWKRQTANRERMSAGQYLSIYTFLLPVSADQSYLIFQILYFCIYCIYSWCYDTSSWT